MKCVLFLSIIAVCSAEVVNEEKPYELGDRYFYFPGGDGVLRLVDTYEAVNNDFIARYGISSSQFWLFTRQTPNNPHNIRINDFGSLFSSNFDFEKETVIVSHGWIMSGLGHIIVQLCHALLENNDVNVISHDWSIVANMNYFTAKAAVPDVGTELGEFLLWLESMGFSLDKVHLLGFSLGGHLIGNAGRKTESRVRKITALDPAGPFWQFDENRLKQSDAQYVEVIHTNAFLFGYRDPCGHADFYPNGGVYMPNCLFSSVCSHLMSIAYLYVSVKYPNQFIGSQCESVTDALFDKCYGDTLHMGTSDLTKNRTGIYRVNTTGVYPFFSFKLNLTEILLEEAMFYL